MVNLAEFLALGGETVTRSSPAIRLLVKLKVSLGVTVTPPRNDGVLLLSRGSSQPVTIPADAGATGISLPFVYTGELDNGPRWRSGIQKLNMKEREILSL